MTLVTKIGCEYNDGGLACIIAIEEVIWHGATHVDSIILNIEFQQTNRVHSLNAFDDFSSIFGFISDRIEYQILKTGALVAHEKNIKLSLFIPLGCWQRILWYLKKVKCLGDGSLHNKP